MPAATAPHADAPSPAADPWPLTPAWRIGALQAALALSWTVYALFLPALAARAGLPASAVPWLLMADQLLFVLFDNLAGLFADRLADAFRRLAGWMSLAGAGAAAAFGGIALLPGAGGAAWLPVVVVWLACSSLLRVPAMVMLSRRRGASRAHGTVSLAVVGLGLAGAVGPLLGRALAGLDPVLPFALAALALAVAVAVVLVPVRAAAPDSTGSGAADVAGGGPVSRGAAASAPSGAASASVSASASASTASASASASAGPAPAWSLAAVMAVGALAVQCATVLAPAPGAAAAGLPAFLWASLFWGGCALGCIVAPRWAEGPGRGPAVARALAAAALLAAAGLAWPPAQAVVLPLAGAAWAVAMAGLFSAALRAPDRPAALAGGGTAPGAPAWRRTLGAAVGLLCAAQAAAAALRLALAGSGLAAALPAAALAPLLWAAAAALAWRHPWLRADVAEAPRRGP